MTKVQLTFNLTRGLTDDDMKQISKVHTVYGVFVVRIVSSGQALFVEYDSARMSVKEVRAMLQEHGLPVE